MNFELVCATIVLFSLIAGLVTVSIQYTDMERYNKEINSDAVRLEFLEKARKDCGEQRFIQYNNCSNPIGLEIPTLEQRNRNQSWAKEIDLCNYECERYGNPKSFEQYSFCQFCGVVWLSIIILVSMLVYCCLFFDNLKK